MSPAFMSGKTGIVLNVYTRPESRRQGHARKLMEAMLADAKAMDLAVIELKATDDGYPLYRSLGFEDDSTTHRAMRMML
jgi:ribosomal protein S18 acetylase RimI-like enzyme